MWSLLLAQLAACERDKTSCEGYLDRDGDGYGAGERLRDCRGLVANADDCDDGDPYVHPGSPEHCNGLDENCDGQVDEDPVDRPWSWRDQDGDGYGDPSQPNVPCEAPPDYVVREGDCDDADPEVGPAALERCNGRDDDCDGLVDDEDDRTAPRPLWWRDQDGDGHGDPHQRLSACQAPDGWVATWDDCDDQDASVHPGALEQCGGADEDCDGQLDGFDPDVPPVHGWWLDRDGDGLGDGASPSGCAEPRRGAARRGLRLAAVRSAHGPRRALRHPAGRGRQGRGAPGGPAGGRSRRRRQGRPGRGWRRPPCHWDGDMADMDVLYAEVGEGRMRQPPAWGDQVEQLGAWMDALPVAPGSPSRDEALVQRGRDLFHSEETGCTDCHAPPRYQAPGSFEVGTGGALQVPSLRGVGARLPVMHDGCAEALKERFTDPECGGGDRHGRTSGLSEDDIDAIVAFLTTL